MMIQMTPKQLRSYMDEKGYICTDIAHLAQVSPNTVRRFIEGGGLRKRSLDALGKYAQRAKIGNSPTKSK